VLADFVPLGKGNYRGSVRAPNDPLPQNARLPPSEGGKGGFDRPSILRKPKWKGHYPGVSFVFRLFRIARSKRTQNRSLADTVMLRI
jgi:hypothetical protein